MALATLGSRTKACLREELRTNTQLLSHLQPPSSLILLFADRNRFYIDFLDTSRFWDYFYHSTRMCRQRYKKGFQGKG